MSVLASSLQMMWSLTKMLWVEVAAAVREERPLEGEVVVVRP